MAQHDERESERNKELKKLDALREAQIDKAFAALGATTEGRRLMWWLLQVGKVGAQPFTSNALSTAFNCGELNVGNQILSRITQVDPAVYVRMQQENQDEYRTFSASFDASGARLAPSGSPGAYDSGGE